MRRKIFEQLPDEIKRTIFSFDPTYHEILKKVLKQLIEHAWTDGTLPDSFFEITPEELEAAYSNLGKGLDRT